MIDMTINRGIPSIQSVVCNLSVIYLSRIAMCIVSIRKLNLSLITQSGVELKEPKIFKSSLFSYLSICGDETTKGSKLV